MRKFGVSLGLLLVLSACGDPLAGVMRISDVDLAETDATAQALPSDEEIAREGFFGTDAAASSETPVEGAALSDTTRASSQAAEEAVGAEPAPQGGLFGLLRRAVPARKPATGAQSAPFRQMRLRTQNLPKPQPPRQKRRWSWQHCRQSQRNFLPAPNGADYFRG
ncbi:hypothetical protein ACFQDZ_16520 [Sulfitobacter pacificus]|uniref:hypothetical protein n=1 Tax=Sulfitobacter pacificus TaxID=1499314 RepID=UPI003611576E